MTAVINRYPHNEQNEQTREAFDVVMVVFCDDPENVQLYSRMPRREVKEIAQAIRQVADDPAMNNAAEEIVARSDDTPPPPPGLQPEAMMTNILKRAWHGTKNFWFAILRGIIAIGKAIGRGMVDFTRALALVVCNTVRWFGDAIRQSGGIHKIKEFCSSLLVIGVAEFLVGLGVGIIGGALSLPIVVGIGIGVAVIGWGTMITSVSIMLFCSDKQD